MTKRDFELMGKVFEAEILGRVYQGKSKRLVELESLGMIQRVERIIGQGISRCKVQGWAHTLAGNIEYCEECSRREPAFSGDTP